MDARPFSFEQTKILMEETLRLKDSAFAKRLFSFVGEKPAVLLPYLPRLVSSGLLERAKSLEWVRDRLHGVHTLSGTSFYTHEEAAEKKRIEEEVKSKYPKGEYDLSDNLPSKNLPHPLWKRWHVIERQARRRGTEHVLSAWSEYADILDVKQREELLRDFANQQMPVFLFVTSWEKSGIDVGTFLSRIDRDGYSAFHTQDLEDLHALIAAGYEREAMDYLLKDIRKFHGDSYVIGWLVKEWDKMRTWFSEDAARQIESALTKTCPRIWMQRLDVALKEQIVPMSKIMQDLSDYEPWSFLRTYERLLFYAKQKPPVSPAVDVTPEMLNDRARECVLTHPDYFFREGVRAHRFFSADEMLAIVKKEIADNTDVYFFDALAKAVVKDPRWIALRQDVIERLERDTDLFVALFEDGCLSNPELSEALFGEAKFEEIFFRHLPLLRLQKYYSFSAMQWLFGNRRRSQRLIRALEEARREEEVVFYAARLDEIQEEIKRREKENKEKKDVSPQGMAASRLSHERQEAMESSSQGLLSLMRRWATELPWFYFEHSNSLRIKGISKRDIPWKEATAFLRDYPEAITNILSYAPELEAGELARANVIPLLALGVDRLLAFSTDHMGRAFPKDVIMKIRQLQPLVRVYHQYMADAGSWSFDKRQKVKEEDFYTAVLRESRVMSWYPLVGDTLEKIASEEQEREGIQTNSSEINIPPLFIESVRRIALLGAEPSLEKYREEILSKPKQEQQRIGALLTTAVLHRWLPMSVGAADYPLFQLEEDVRKQAAEHYRRVFRLPKEDERGIVFSHESLDALREYFLRSCVDEPELRAMVQKIVVLGGAEAYASWKQWDGKAGEESLRVMQERGWVPKNVSPDAYKHWSQDDRMEVQEILRWDAADIGKGLRCALDQAVADHHLPAETLQMSDERMAEEERKLQTPILERQERLGELQRKMKEARAEKRPFEEEDEYRFVQEEINEYRREHAADLQKAQALRLLKRFPHLTVQELEKKVFSMEKKVVPWMQAFKIIEEGFRKEHPEFLQDVARMRDQLYQGFEQLFGGKRLSRETLEVTDCTDAETAIFIGEKPVPSCQSYKSTGMYNRGLLSLVVDPNVKIIQIRNERGNIIARSVFRLLEDADGKPTLFIERIYSTNPHPKIAESIMAFAKRKVEVMGCKIYSHAMEGLGDEAGEHETATLISRGSRAPYVYTDAGGGLRRGGKYEIKNAVSV